MVARPGQLGLLSANQATRKQSLSAMKRSFREANFLRYESPAYLDIVPDSARFSNKGLRQIH